MSEGKWTDEQWAAIKEQGNLLVAAAAGSGKTAVLVERLIRRMMDPDQPIDVDRFLVVTFTKAAAGEMLERIRQALHKALFAEQNIHDASRLLQQLNLLPKANITTLHSFCLEQLRQNFYGLDLDPAFRVADEAEAELLRQDVVQELFERAYESENPVFLKLVEAFGSDRDDIPLMEHVLRIYNFAYSQVDPEAWLTKLSTAYEWQDTDSLAKSVWGQAVRQGLWDKLNLGIELMAQALRIAQTPEGPAAYLMVIDEELQSMHKLAREIQEGSWNEIERLFAFDFGRLPAARSAKKGKSCSPKVDEERQIELREKCKALRDQTKKIFSKVKEELFSWPLAEQLPLLKEMQVLVGGVADLVIEFSHDYAKAKRKRNIVDFSDLEHFALKLFSVNGQATPIAEKLQDYFAEILVDEYQDINPVQEKILQMVSGAGENGPSLFMVGDVKQSIYRFRMADPSLFQQKYLNFPHWDKNLSNKGTEVKSGMVIDLARNFRSRLGIIEGVNTIFRQIMTEEAGEIAYDDRAALQYGASFVGSKEGLKTAEGPIEVHLIDLENTAHSHCSAETLSASEVLANSEGQDETGQAGEDFTATRQEARLVAERIKQMVIGESGPDGIFEPEFQIYDKELGDFRPVRYSDIIILMRSYSVAAPIYDEEFQKAGIPLYAETSSGYFAASEVETILSLLKVIDNPRQDIPLAAILRSPFVNLNGSELGKLRLILPKGDFYEALTLAVWAAMDDKEEMPAEIAPILSAYRNSWPRLIVRAQEILKSASGLGEKLKTFWLKLQVWRTLSRRNSLAELLWHLYEETGYLAYVGTLPNGLQRQANLRVLYDRACRYEATRYRGLFRFLRFLDKFREQGKDMGMAKTLGENEDVVRIMSVHASKGLEFPVVFMVGLGHGFNTQSLKGKILLHSKLGMGIPIVDIENKVRYPSFIQYGIKQRLTQEALAEELRILYVAMTRAREKLLLYGSQKKLSEQILNWQQATEWAEVSLPDSYLRNAKCYLDWLGPALARANGLTGISTQWMFQVHPCTGNSTENSTENSTGQAANQEGPLALNPEESSSLEYWYQLVDQRLNWKYPYLTSVNQTAKTSVSELKRRFIWYTDEEENSVVRVDSKLPTEFETLNFKRPKFLQKERKLTAAEKGILIHTAMQHLPFNEWQHIWFSLKPQEQFHMMRDYIASLKQRLILTEEQVKGVALEKILTLLNSNLGKRLLNGQVQREVPFSLNLQPKDFSRPLLVQGVIDALIISNGHKEKDYQEKVIFYQAQDNVELVDYKTDTFSSDTPNPEKRLLERYGLQLALYSLAVERLLKIKVDRCTIYSFYLEREIDLSSELRAEILTRFLHN